MFIEGANNPGNRANVNSVGHLNTDATTITQQSDKALGGDAYNLNTSTFTLTDANETALFYIKNDSEERDMIISRIFVAFGASTGGSGELEGKIMRNPTGGSVIASGVDKAPENFNFGSSKVLAVTSKLGTTALGACTGGVEPIEFFFTGDSQRHLIGFEAIILPRGAAMCFSLIPPAGNTSMKVQAGANIYLAGEA